MTSWDVTITAASHATLCGVLSGLVLVMIPLFLSRRDPGGSAAIVTRLVGAGMLLMIAAVIFGGLSGQPRASDLAPSDSVVVGRSILTGTVGVTLMVVGGYYIAWGLVIFASFGPPGEPRTEELGVGSALLLGTILFFGEYERLLFLTWAHRAYEASAAVVPLGLLALVAAIVVLLPIVLGRTLGRFGWVRRLQPKTAFNLGVAACAISVLGYTIIPPNQPLTDLAYSSYDTLARIVLIVASATSAAFEMIAALSLGRSLSAVGLGRGRGRQRRRPGRRL